ncbi:hypothetical protein [Pararhodonellum marinum]|uniref:hypothetical protein n=1 Tax=Pararhodonellum marinum TaxID=2755358 RepID=UPI0018908BCA|nr:hypothetical protein [Pararhodonellum marinum]
MKKTFATLLILLTFGAGQLVFGQKYLLLQKGSNQKTRIKYEVGEIITYQTKDYDYFLTDVIKEIQRDYLLLNENILRPEDITAIDISNKDERNRTIRNLSTLAFAAGGLVLATETINSLYQEGSLSYSTGGLVISGSLLTTGFVLSKSKYKYFKRSGRRKIEIVYLDAD